MHTPLQYKVANTLAQARHTRASDGPQPWATMAHKGIAALRVISVLGAGGACGSPAGSEIDAYARHALAANGFGDAGIGHFDRSPSPAAGRAVPAKQASRLSRLARAIEQALQSLGARLRHRRARAEPRRVASATFQLLRGLDSHTLRDLGFDRSELTSVAAEAAGEIVATRVRCSPSPLCRQA